MAKLQAASLPITQTAAPWDGQTPSPSAGKMDEKLKSEIMQKEQSSELEWGRGEGRCRERRYADHYIFIQIYFRMHHFVAGLRRSRAWVQIAAATLLRNSLRQTVYIQRASVHQAAKLVAALLRAAQVTAGLMESNGSLPSGL